MPPNEDNKEDIFKKIKEKTLERLNLQIENLSSETDELALEKKEKRSAILNETNQTHFNLNNQPEKAYVLCLVLRLKNKENYKLFSEVRHTHGLPFRIFRSIGFILLSLITLGIFFIRFLYDWHKKTGSLNFLKSRSQAIIDQLEASVRKEDPAALNSILDENDKASESKAAPVEPENTIDENDKASKLKAKHIANLEKIEKAISDFKTLCDESNSKLDFNDENLSKLSELYETHTVENFITNFKKLTIEKSNQNFKKFYTIVKNLESFSLPEDNLLLFAVTNTKYSKNIENIFLLAQALLIKIPTFDIALLTEESVLHLIYTKRDSHKNIDIEKISETLERVYKKDPENIKKKETLLEEYDKPISSPASSSSEKAQVTPLSSSASPSTETLTASSSSSSLIAPATVEQSTSTTNYLVAQRTLLQLEKITEPEYLNYNPKEEPAIHDNAIILKAIDTLLKANDSELITPEMINFLYKHIKQTPAIEEINLQKLIELHQIAKNSYIIRCILSPDKNEIINLKNIEGLVDNILMLHRLPYPHDIFNQENLSKIFNMNSKREERGNLFLF